MPNQPAFPIHDPFAVECPKNVQEALLLRNGMDLRDYFAKGVMQAEFSAQSDCNGVGVIPVFTEAYNEGFKAGFHVGVDSCNDKIVDLQLNLKSANDDLRIHRELMLKHIAENHNLSVENENLRKTNIVCQKEFDELLKDYNRLEDELQIIEDQHHYYGD